MGLSAWPLGDSVVSQELIYNLFDHLYATEGVLHPNDLQVIPDNAVHGSNSLGLSVRVLAGGAVISYDSVFGGKRVFYNSGDNASGPNMFPNRSFDANIQQWQAIGGATLTRDTGTFHSSPASGKIATGGASAFTRGIRNPFSAQGECLINPDTDQEITCWVNAPVGTAVRLSVQELNASYVSGAVFTSPDYPGTGVWNKISLKWKSSATARFMLTSVLIQCAGAVNVFVDDFTNTRNFEWGLSFEVADDVNPRIDRVGVLIADQEVPGSTDPFSRSAFAVLPGTPTAGANLTNLNGAFAIPNNFFLLANVLVSANSVLFQSSDIDTTVRKVASLNVPATGMGTSLPASPVDGQEFILTDSLSAPTYAWHLRYNASLASNKWLFVGGAPLISEVTNSDSATSTSYAALATAGPTITLPVAGDYEVAIGARIQVASGELGQMSYDIGGTGAVDADQISNQITATPTTDMNVMRTRKKTGLGAVALTAKYKVVSGTVQFQDRWMRVTPIRIGG